MSKPKFTPGPWKWLDDDYSRLISTKPEPNEFSPTGSCLPTVMRPDFQSYGYCDGGDSYVEISDADAKLIAAAPDMYEALAQAVETYGHNGGPWNVSSEPGTWLCAARDALSKARGEA